MNFIEVSLYLSHGDFYSTEIEDREITVTYTFDSFTSQFLSKGVNKISSTASTCILTLTVLKKQGCIKFSPIVKVLNSDCNGKYLVTCD